MNVHRQKVPDGSAMAKALDYSLKRQGAFTRITSDGKLRLMTHILKIRFVRLPSGATIGFLQVTALGQTRSRHHKSEAKC
jgi:hypothetical protein